MGRAIAPCCRSFAWRSSASSAVGPSGAAYTFVHVVNMVRAIDAHRQGRDGGSSSWGHCARHERRNCTSRFDNVVAGGLVIRIPQSVVRADQRMRHGRANRGRSLRSTAPLRRTLGEGFVVGSIDCTSGLGSRPRSIWRRGWRERRRGYRDAGWLNRPLKKAHLLDHLRWVPPRLALVAAYQK